MHGSVNSHTSNVYLALVVVETANCLEIGPTVIPEQSCKSIVWASQLETKAVSYFKIKSFWPEVEKGKCKPLSL